MPSKPKRSSSARRKPAESKNPGKHDLTKPRQATKARSAGSKFSHRPYKPRKPKAKRPRSAEAILQEARATRQALIRQGSRRRSSQMLSRPAAHVVAPVAQPSGRIFPPILDPLGNPPAIASGRGQYDPRPEVWVADDYYLIVEADPACVNSLAQE